MDNPAALLARFDDLSIWKQGDQRAPHKPLLDLYALGWWQAGQKGVAFRRARSNCPAAGVQFPQESDHAEQPFCHSRPPARSRSRYEGGREWRRHASGIHPRNPSMIPSLVLPATASKDCRHASFVSAWRSAGGQSQIPCEASLEAADHGVDTSPNPLLGLYLVASLRTSCVTSPSC